MQTQIAVLACLALAAACHSGQVPTRPPTPGADSLALERSSCFGFCPAYRLSLHSDGTVIFAGREGGYGNVLVIDHGYGVKTRYGHLSKLEVKTGDRVRIWVDNLAINEPLAFHTVGMIFDTVWKEGNYLLKPNQADKGGSQTLDLSITQGGFVEFTAETPGTYTFVNHIMKDLERGAAGLLVVGDGGPSPLALARRPGADRPAGMLNGTAQPDPRYSVHAPRVHRVPGARALRAGIREPLRLQSAQLRAKPSEVCPGASWRDLPKPMTFKAVGKIFNFNPRFLRKTGIIGAWQHLTPQVPAGCSPALRGSPSSKRCVERANPSRSNSWPMSSACTATRSDSTWRG